jgi:hypothetical protein
LPAELLSSKSFSTFRTSSTVRAIGWLTAGVVRASSLWERGTTFGMVMMVAFFFKAMPLLDFSVLLGILGSLPEVLLESEISLSYSLNLLSTRISLEFIMALFLVDSCFNSSEEFLDHCRMSMSDSEGKISFSSSADILDSLVLSEMNIWSELCLKRCYSS